TGHGGGGTTAQPDQHGRTAEHAKLRAHRHFTFCDMVTANVAPDTGDHDGLVMSAAALRPIAGGALFKGTKVPADVWSAEFIVEGRRAERSLDHDVGRR